ncbi:MAG: phosphotransferase family protein [Hyphomonadaceae bacterium]|nr:phosphotransferase family protein [Hyphomonadaceae bacterium]
MLTRQEIDRLLGFLERALPDVTKVGVGNIARVHSGVSRETYSVDLQYTDKRGDHARGLLIRRDLGGGLRARERAIEHAAYRSFFGKGVPVPEPFALVEDASVLGGPFLILDRIEGHAPSIFQPDPYGGRRETTGRDFFAILGAIAAADPYDTQLPGVVDTPAAEDCWRRELDHWERVLARDSLEPQPIAAAAIRRLRRNPPKAPPRLAVVHGDFRKGNFMIDAQGRIVGVLDWELAHIGDPMEDLAWALDPLWAGETQLAAGLLDWREAIEIWQSASRRVFNAEALNWWSLFSHVKGIAIWTSAARAYHDGRNQDPILAFTGWYCAARHNKMIADRLASAGDGMLL